MECRPTDRPPLVTITNCGFMRMFSAPHVIEEVEEHLPRWA